MRRAILAFIDFFHPPFKKYISLHNFRYLATGGSTFVLGQVIFYIAYNFVFLNDLKYFDFTISRNSISLAVEFAIVIPYSFILNKYIIFTHSEVKSRVQLFRFLNLQLINMLLNYVLMKGFTDILNIYPTISRLIVGVGIAGFSYIYQHYFTFSVKKFGKKQKH